MKRIVRKRKGNIEKAKKIVIMHSSMYLIVYSIYHIDLKMVSSENLIGLINVALSFCQVLGLREMTLNLLNIDLRNP